MQKYLDNIGDVRENKQDIQTSMAVYIQNIRGKEERVRLVNRDQIICLYHGFLVENALGVSYQ